jgi:hypothetical protein
MLPLLAAGLTDHGPEIRVGEDAEPRHKSRTAGSKGRLPPALGVRLHRLVMEWIRRAPLRAPFFRESEEAYTDEVLVPALRDLLERDQAVRAGILVGGHHTGISRPVPLVGSLFFPDLAVIYREHKVIALEVKYLADGADRSGALARALGQAAAYRHGYDFVGIVLLDRGTRRFTYSEPTAKDGLVSVVVRKQIGERLREGRLLHL